MKISTLKTVCSSLPSFVSVMIRGGYGIGKSEAVAQLASEYFKLPMIDRRLSQMTEGDLLGLPSTDGNVTRFNPPDWIRAACLAPHVLFLDEINRATPEVTQAAFQLVLDRQLNGNVLHPESRVFTAINASAEYQVNEVDPALLDRFFVVDLEADLSEFLTHLGPTFPDLLKEFLTQQPNALTPTRVESGKIAPSPRSWYRLGKSMTIAGVSEKPEDPLFYQLAAGFVGSDLAQSLVSYGKSHDTKLTAQDILNDGHTAPVKKKVAASTPEKRSLLVDELVTAIEAMASKDDAVPGSEEEFSDSMADNVASFYKVLDPEARVRFTCSMLGIAEKPNGVRQLPKIIAFHSRTVTELLEVFGVKPGQEGVGMEPNIPAFLKKDLALSQRGGGATPPRVGYNCLRRQENGKHHG